MLHFLPYAFLCFWYIYTLVYYEKENSSTVQSYCYQHLKKLCRFYKKYYKGYLLASISFHFKRHPKAIKAIGNWKKKRTGSQFVETEAFQLFLTGHTHYAAHPLTGDSLSPQNEKLLSRQPPVDNIHHSKLPRTPMYQNKLPERKKNM